MNKAQALGLGKLERPPDTLDDLARRGQLINECFVIFAVHVYPNAPAGQLREMKVCFFAGTAELFAVMQAGMDDGVSETDDDLKFMEQWVDEIERFHKNTMATMNARTSRQ